MHIIMVINCKGKRLEFIDLIYNYLVVNMDTEVVLHLMLSNELISDSTTLAASSDYQLNVQLLEKIQQMSNWQFESFCELLINSVSQRDFGQFLLQGQ